MHDWKKRITRKRSRFSTTPGRTKADCVASPEERCAARRSRAYKMKFYSAVLEKWAKKNAR